MQETSTVTVTATATATVTLPLQEYEDLKVCRQAIEKERTHIIYTGNFHGKNAYCLLSREDAINEVYAKCNASIEEINDQLNDILHKRYNEEQFNKSVLEDAKKAKFKLLFAGFSAGLLLVTAFYHLIR